MLLKSYNAQGILKVRFDQRVHKRNRLLTRTPLRPMLRTAAAHRSRSPKRRHCHKIIELRDVHRLGHALHGNAVELEHTGIMALVEHVKGGLVIERNIFKVLACGWLADQFQRAGKHAKLGQTQGVNLEQAERINVTFITHGNAHAGFVAHVKRHVVYDRLLRKHNARRMLPGIAGVILTVGMGVDSNVLIFERIREELRHGKTPPQAVDQGFKHAWVTIIDTHVTTIVSAIILFLFGTGPVRGFAVTLSFGLAANLFTSVFVSRVIFDAILNRHQRGEALSI